MRMTHLIAGDVSIVMQAEDLWARNHGVSADVRLVFLHCRTVWRAVHTAGREPALGVSNQRHHGPKGVPESPLI
eukprot:286699-Pelagomonas_calceolata.AAC.5